MRVLLIFLILLLIYQVGEACEPDYCDGLHPIERAYHEEC